VRIVAGKDDRRLPFMVPERTLSLSCEGALDTMYVRIPDLAEEVVDQSLFRTIRI
jgi:hypothetical protein